MTEVDLATDLGGLAMASPVMTAAGCGGRELAAYADLTALGALVTRTVTLDARAGSPPPRVVETPGGVVSAVGLQNPGLQGFLSTDLPWLAQRRVRTVVSISAGSLAEYGELARRLGDGVLAKDVGSATGRNPLSVVVPCHRVVGKDGSLTGYAGGLKRKRYLLDLESAVAPAADRLF